jgi:hypothetical protein
VLSEPTALKEGERIHTCSECHKAISEKIPVISQSPNAPDNSSEGDDGGSVTVIIIISASVVLIGAGAVTFIVIKRKK